MFTIRQCQLARKSTGAANTVDMQTGFARDAEGTKKNLF